MFDLQVLSSGGEIVYLHRLGARPCQVGRAPVNDLVINETMVSQFHALLWVEGDRAYIRDLGSRNGTFHNGTRLQGTQPLAVGDLVGIGPDTRLKIAAALELELEMASLVVQDESTGVCWPIRGDRLYFGSSEECEIQCGEGSERIATLIVTGPEEFWLGEGTEDRPLELGAGFEVDSRTYKVVRREALFETTAVPLRQAVTGQYPYRIRATLDGPTGPEAMVDDLNSGTSYKVDAENRAVLLYLLTRQWVNDDEADSASRGWCSNETLLTGVWGRNAQDDNKLHVLVYRLRNELKKVGFDPWFIEKRRRFTRLRLLDAEID